MGFQFCFCLTLKQGGGLLKTELSCKSLPHKEDEGRLIKNKLSSAAVVSDLYLHS